MNKPIILDNAISRTGDSNKIFEYDFTRDMNMLKKEFGTGIFIDMDSSLPEWVTKTKAERERDDEAFSFAELQTKTFTERERDDEDDFAYN